MAIEIERKFLASGPLKKGRGTSCVQGYLVAERGLCVRVRTMGAKAYLTVKGPSRGAARSEFEYAIPFKDALALLALCDRPPIRKRRYEVRYAGKLWEIDEFEGENRGLVVAEIELGGEKEKFALPPWVGREVTGDPRYFNAALYRRPYRSWRARSASRKAP